MSIFSVFAVVPLVYGKWPFVKRLGMFCLIGYSSAVSIIGVVTTNLIPPKVEADFLHLKYNYLRNLDFLKSDTSGSYIYNTYFSGTVTLLEYAYVLFWVLMVLFAFTLFILPLFETKRISTALMQSEKEGINV